MSSCIYFLSRYKTFLDLSWTGAESREVWRTVGREQGRMVVRMITEENILIPDVAENTQEETRCEFIVMWPRIFRGKTLEP